MSISYYRDDELLEKGSRRANKWIVRYRQGKANRSETFAKAEGFTLDDAITLDQAIKRQKKMGGIDPRASERDFGEVVESWWRSHHAKVSASTRRTQRAYLENRILAQFDGLRLCDLTSPVIDAFRLQMEHKGTGAPTQRKVLYVLSSVFAYAKRMGYVTYNPVDVIEKPAAGRHRLIQPFPPERVEKVRNWFLHRNDLEGATMVSVLAYSGPRPEEAHSILTWGDITENNIIYRAGKTKKDRSTRLLAPLRDDLRAWWIAQQREDWEEPLGIDAEGGQVVRFPPGGKVFGWSDTRFDEWRRGDRPGGFGQAAKDCGIAPTRPYDLRHAFATLLFGEGQRIPYVAEQLGHTVATCTRWYTHLDNVDKETQDAEERIWAARTLTKTSLGMPLEGKAFTNQEATS